MVFLKTKWVLELLGVLAVALLIWFIGPLIAIAGAIPLESEWARWLAIGILVAVWLAYRMLHKVLSTNREKKMIADLATADANDAASASEAELDVLRRGFEDALQLLKTPTGKSRGSQYLYELPWYAIIGAPGSGKTTALINSGLHFPLAERLGKHAIKGVSGTRDCDWWFSDEAVLLDTAGRYTTQDSHQQVDASAWHGFLQLLKKYRPRRPLNGVFVAVSVGDLMRQTEEEIRQHATAVRQRIMELNGQLGVQLPVYVLFTKTDLLAGFTDFYANLSEDERGQVWGETFAPGVGVQDLPQHLDQFRLAYDELVDRLLQRRLKRMQEERDLQRRAAIFDFPQQMMLLKSSALQFLETTFAVSRYEEPFLLRGVYFSSGTQEGTPIDRVLSALASSFRLERQAVPMMSGRGKSFFLGKLLKQVVFSEADLVGVDPKIERRYRLLSLGAYAATAGVVAIAVVCWFVSLTANKLALAEVEKHVAAFRASNAVGTDTRSGFVALLPKLNALTDAREVYRQVGWSGGFGLYQGDKIEAGVNVAYEKLLRDNFLPLVVVRLKERMQGDEGANLDVLYQLLRVYLMFGDPKRMDIKVAQPWVKLDWEHQFSTDPETQAQLLTHLDNLLALDLDSAPIDNSFVTSVRNKLTQVPLVNQVYSRFKSEALFDHDHDVILAGQLAPNGDRVFSAANGKGLDSLIVPGLFTGYGYTDWFLKKGMDYVKEAASQNWVLGVSATDTVLELDRLYGDFKRLYLADYQKTWDGVLTAVKFRPQPSTTQLVDTLDLLSRPDSPLKLLLELVEKNTSLSKLSANLADSLTKAAGGGLAVPEAATQKLLAMAKQGDSGIDPVKALEAYFEPFNLQVRGAADRPAPIASTLTSLKNLHDYLMQIGAASNAGGQALSTEAAKAAGGGIDPIQAAKMEFARLPGPIAASLNALTATGGQQIKTGAKGQLNDLLKTSVSLPCKAALTGRYPFAKNTPQDVLMADFGKVFAANGVVDQFFNTNLKAFVDTAQVQWRELASDNALGLAPASIRQFQIAAKIRDAFFPNGGAVPQVQFELKPLTLDDRIGTFRLNVEGQELVYRHGPEQLTKFQWPGTNNSAGVRVVFEALDGKQVSRTKEGAWALFRMLDEFNIEPTSLPDRFNLTVQLEGYSARFELRAASVNNPFGISEYQTFRCPESL